MKAVLWPWNQPGCNDIAPPWTGQFVRFVEVGIPPPRRREGVSAFIALLSVIDRRVTTYMDTAIACHTDRYRIHRHRLARDHPPDLRYRWRWGYSLDNPDIPLLYVHPPTPHRGLPRPRSLPIVILTPNTTWYSGDQWWRWTDQPSRDVFRGLLGPYPGALSWSGCARRHSRRWGLPRKEDVELLHHLVPPAVLKALNDHHYWGRTGTFGTFWGERQAREVHSGEGKKESDKSDNRPTYRKL